MSMFAIHFRCLTQPGDGDGFMSSEFKQSLAKDRLEDVPADVAFGSSVTIKHLNTHGGFLHSHAHVYPAGSKQQQITLYPHKDDNNVWILTNQTDFMYNTTAPVFIEDGAIVRLWHPITDKRLHSHDVRPPMTEAEWQNEVSGYGFAGFEGDANDWFRIEIAKSQSQDAVSRKRLRAIDTKFRLVHAMTGCVLFSHKVKLPSWGFEQQEVTCARGGTLPNSLWYIESNSHPTLPKDAEKVNYHYPSFLSKFWELQKVMWKTNAGLVESHAWDSRPSAWPTLRRGINFWTRDHRQIYLLGNPLIWWSTSAAVFMWVGIKLLLTLRWQRGYSDYSKNVWVKLYDWPLSSSFLGWFMHYIPFFLMQRQLFLHHYFPALYFGILTFSELWDLLAKWATKSNQRRMAQISVVYLAIAIRVFMLYSPLAYGGVWTKAQCEKVKLISTWDFDCNSFFTNADDYAKLAGGEGGMPTVDSSGHQVPPANEPQPVKQNVLAGGIEEASEQALQETAQKPTGDRPKYEHVVYRDEHGNEIPEDVLKSLQSQYGDALSMKTIYETETKTLRPGDPIPEGAREVYEPPEYPDVSFVQISWFCA